MKLKHVYVIEQCCYSDYRVVGIYLNKKDADMVATLINSGDSWDEATVNKWELNPCIAELNANKKLFRICMDITGEVERITETTIDGYDVGDIRLSVWSRTTAPAYRSKKINDAINGSVWATDEKHAIKICNEYRGVAIANNNMKHTVN